MRRRSVLKSAPARRSNGFSRGGGKGSRAPRPRGGSRSPLEDYADGVLALVGERPDWTLEVVRRGPAQAENAGQPQRAVAFSGASRHQLQKKACARLSSNEPMSPGRAGIGSGSRPCFDSSSLVFIDETWVNTTMARRYGRCPRGERLIGRVPLGTWKTLTFVAGLRCDEMTAPLVIEGAMNGEIFLSYVEQCLAPALNHGDIVVMDNLRAHKVAGVEQAIEAVGAELL